MIKQLKQYVKNKLVRVEKEKILIPYIKGEYLLGRCALITGGTSGLGYAIAEAFLRNGAKVIITGRNLEKLEHTKEKMVKETNCGEGKVSVAKLAINEDNYVEKELEEIIQTSTDPISILVNNAGINGGKMFPDTSYEEYDRVLNTNLRGMYFISQYIIKYMIHKNIKGNVLNITSSSSLRPATSPYIISKWGERGLTMGMAKKFLPYGITVNAIAPGSAATPMLLNDNDNKNDLFLDYSPAKRYVAPEEVGNMAVILVSEIGRMIVGDTIYMTGGAGVLTVDDIQY